MGFKIQHALKVGQIAADGLPSDAPAATEEGEKQQSLFSLVDQSLFDLTALLIKYDVIALEEIWPHIESKMPSQAEETKGDEVDELLEK